MKNCKECPWYVRIFSFLAVFVLIVASGPRLAARLFRDGFQLELWLRFCGEVLLDWFVFFMLPMMVLAVVVGSLATGLWNWLGFPLLYVLGLYPAVRIWYWRKENL